MLCVAVCVMWYVIFTTRLISERITYQTLSSAIFKALFNFRMNRIISLFHTANQLKCTREIMASDI